jgi:nicotinamide-nucleotide amidase
VRAELVSVGTELLLGELTDTNSAWIAARLAEIGVDVHRQVTVGDNVDRIVEVLADAVRQADAVIVTGGLGPTQDDLTRFAVARLAGVGLRRDPDLEEHVAGIFARIGRHMPANNLVQADLPEGAQVLAPVGTAAGFALDVEGSTIYCLPGVPREMEVMLARDVLPALTTRGGLAATVSRVVRTAGLSESAVAERLAPLVQRLDEAPTGSGRVTLAFLASKGETRVRLTGKSTSREAGLALVNPVVDEVAGLLGRGVTGLDDEGPEYAVGRRLLAEGWTLAVAESVTGGHMAARIVGVPGASEWFRGGVVVYTPEAKTALAGVTDALLTRYGLVSEETAAALASGARDRLAADVGVGVVGVAGPSTQGGREVGTVCLAVALPGTLPITRELRLPGRSRSEVQEWAASAALDELRRRLAEV